MPPVIIGVAVAVGAYGTVGLVAAIALGALAAVAYQVSMPDMSAPGTSPQSAKQTIRTANQPYRGVFGKTIISGPLIFAEEYLHESGYSETYESCRRHSGRHNDREVCTTRTRWIDTSEKWLHLVIALTGHEVDSIPEVYFGDKLQTDYDHEFWKIHVLTGRQTRIQDLPEALRNVPSWKNDMIGKGVAFVHVQLKHSTTHFPNGIPNIKCLIKGAKLSTPFFNGYSNNAAAVIYHYLRHHFGATEKMINTASFVNEYNLCNEPMPGEAGDSGEIPIRYAIDGFFDYDQTHESILGKMLAACGGQLMFTNGQYHLQVAAYRGPVGSSQVISLSDLNAPIDINPDTQLSDRVNTVKGTYVSELADYQVVDFPTVTNAIYVAEDGGEELVHDADFEYVLNRQQAERIANIILKDNRHGLTIKVPMNLKGFKFNVGLPLKFDDESLGYDQLEFRVVTWSINPKSGVTLTIKQTSPDIYDDSVSTVSPKPDEIGVPDPQFSYPVNHLQFIPEPDDGIYDGLLMWAHPDLANNRDFDIVMTSPGGEVIKYNTKATELRLANLLGVTYNVSVIANNRYGAPSVPVTASYSIGAPKAIASVQFIPKNFEVTIVPKVSGALPLNTKFLFFSADDPSNPDVTAINYIGEGTTFTDSGLLPAKPYSYFIQVANSASVTDLFGPYSTETTDDPSDLVDLITPALPGAYTWEVYSVDVFGAGISRTYDPAIHKFKGIAYNKRTEEPSLNPLDYFFTRIGDFIPDEEQAILDNLAAGKFPDGSGDLINADDVLFKVGDKVEVDDIAHEAVTTDKIAVDAVTGDKIKSDAVTTNKLSAQAVTAEKIKTNSITATQIAAGTITSNEIKAGTIQAEDIKSNTITAAQIAVEGITTNAIAAGAITADKLTANSVTTAKIDAGAVTATELAANSVTANKLTANSVTANAVAAGAITADKIAVTVVAPLNNYSESGDLRGWTPQSNATLVDEIQIDGVTARTLKVVSNSSVTAIKSDKFQVDHNAIYEFHFSIYCEQSTDSNRQVFGVSGFDDAGAEVSLAKYHPETLSLLGSETSPEFWGGYVKNGWRNMIAYVVGANASVESCPKSANVNAIIKLGANTRRCQILTQVAATSGTVQTSHFYSPSGVKLGSGSIVANEVRANALISAPVIEGGTINGGVINGATGNFSGEVEAGKVVGVVGAVAKTMPATTVWRARRSSNPNNKDVLKLKVRAEHFDRVLVVRAKFRGQIQGSFPYGFAYDYPRVTSPNKCTRLAPTAGGSVPSDVTVEGIDLDVFRVSPYNSTNSLTGLEPYNINWKVTLPARDKSDDSIMTIELAIGWVLGDPVPYSTRYTLLASSIDVDVVTYKLQSEQDLDIDPVL